jgi:uncharacterized protein (TIGR00369 family)
MQKQPSSRTCFLCGRENDSGLKMEWYNNSDTNQVEGTVIIPEDFNGYPGIVHGGIVAAVLDETAGRAMMLNGDWENLFVTLKLNVTYRKPTPTNTPLKAIGCLEKQGNRSAHVTAELKLPNGDVTAEATAVVVRPPDEFRQMWESEREFWKVDED